MIKILAIFEIFSTFTPMNTNMVEIERKFLVKKEALDSFDNLIEITQGYLTKNENGSVRIRIEKDLSGNEIALLTSKTKLDDNPMSNYETNDLITISTAKRLIEKFSNSLIKKSRHIKYFGGMKWEIDKFHFPNPDLILAEIELDSADEEFELPDWIDKEVTGQSEYYNANM